MSTNDQALKIPYFISDNNGKYKARRALTEKQIFSAANAILKKQFAKGESFTNPQKIKIYLMFKYASYEYEVFVCIFLDSLYRIIEDVEMFRGTINGANIYPREVVKKALALNAAAVIFAHNHPSGDASPSKADKNVTKKLISALNLVDIKTLDHIIVGGPNQYSFVEGGLI